MQGKPFGKGKTQNFQIFGRKYRKHLYDLRAGKDFLNETHKHKPQRKDW